MLVLLAAGSGCSRTFDYTGDSAEADSESPEEETAEDAAASKHPNETPLAEELVDQSREVAPSVNSISAGGDPMAIEPTPDQPSRSRQPEASLFGLTSDTQEESAIDEEDEPPIEVARETPSAPSTAATPASDDGGLDQFFSDFLGDDSPSPPPPPAAAETQASPVEAPPAAVVVKPREAISVQDLFGGRSPAPPEEPTTKPEPPSQPKLETGPESEVAPIEPDVFELPSNFPTPALQPVAKPAAQTRATALPKRIVPKRPELPPTRIDVDNTRHLAWLLGSKVSLASLSHLVDAPVAEDESGWQLRALAELLGVTPPGDLANQSSPGEAIGALLTETRRLAAELAPKLGDDHAALMEVAVKTNLLLTLYEQKPSLAGPIRRAVAAAAPRAGIADSTWRPLVELLDASPTSEEVRGEVFRLHGAVERELLSASPSPDR